MPPCRGMPTKGTGIGVHAQFDRGGSQNLTIRGGSQNLQNRVDQGGPKFSKIGLSQLGTLIFLDFKSGHTGVGCHKKDPKILVAVYVFGPKPVDCRSHKVRLFQTSCALLKSDKMVTFITEPKKFLCI